MEGMSAGARTDTGTARVPAHGKGRLAPKWQPGRSGNPTGTSGEYGEAVRLARRNSVRAISRLVELMEADDERVAAVACNAVWEKAWGKRDPASVDEATGSMRLDLKRLSVEQLTLLVQVMQLGAVVPAEIAPGEVVHPPSA